MGADPDLQGVGCGQRPLRPDRRNLESRWALAVVLAGGLRAQQDGGRFGEPGRQVGEEQVVVREQAAEVGQLAVVD